MENRIEMLFCNGENTPEELTRAEKVLEISFPPNFQDINRNCDNGTPKLSSIVFYDRAVKQINGTCVGAFLSFKSTFSCEDDSILDFYLNPPESFAEGLIAFAVDPFGNYFCFDYREGKDNPDPPIVFWNHEGAGTPDAISPLAPNFEAFLGMLKSEEEAEKEYEELRAKYHKDG